MYICSSILLHVPDSTGCKLDRLLGAKFSGPQWLYLECVLGACFSGPRHVFSDRNAYNQSAFWVLNFPDRHGCNENAFWVLPSRTATCLFGLQWMQSECVLGAEFFGPPWLQLECVFGAAFTDRGMSSRTAPHWLSLFCVLGIKTQRKACCCRVLSRE